VNVPFRPILPPFLFEETEDFIPPQIRAVPPIAFGSVPAVAPALSDVIITTLPTIAPALTDVQVGAQCGPYPALTDAVIQGGGGDSIILGPVSTISQILAGALTGGNVNLPYTQRFPRRKQTLPPFIFEEEEDWIPPTRKRIRKP
jgi:hypothetical protein